jgi:hypothetical protein
MRGVELKRLKMAGPPLSFSLEGSKLATDNDDAEVVIWDVANREYR